MGTRLSSRIELVRYRKLGRRKTGGASQEPSILLISLQEEALLKRREETSTWQDGPEFLRWPVEEWPIRSAGEVAAQARESVDKLQRKAFSAAITRAQAEINQRDGLEDTQGNIKRESQGEEPSAKQTPTRTLTGKTVEDLVEVKNFSSLQRLVRVIAWVRRAAKKWLEIKDQPRTGSKVGVVSLKEKVKGATITVKEFDDALKYLFRAAQENATFPHTTMSRLAVYRHEESGLLVCGGQIQMFNEDKTAVALIPFEAWVSTLLAQEAHKANHEGVAGTLLRMRKKAWVIKGRLANLQRRRSTAVLHAGRSEQNGANK
ncbi:uncharacterized protein [Pseudochaenichthys georgianus]|uniref:uncharacterized protein n=1 Tax=Pseudochaenichthys georgianus TaxID=52239 RepID=UPI00146BEB6C|nr:uncharacterized protein LOC117458914 [Pseudochaenichthys georgianus]